MGTGRIADNFAIITHQDPNPFVIRTLAMGSMDGGRTSEWTFPASTGGEKAFNLNFKNIITYLILVWKHKLSGGKHCVFSYYSSGKIHLIYFRREYNSVNTNGIHSKGVHAVAWF